MLRVLVSHDKSKNDIITYGLDRLSNLQITEENAQKPVEFNSENYFKYAVGITANNKSLPETVLFKAENVAAKYIDSQPFHFSQKLLKEGKNRTSFELKVMISEELIRSILSYGGEIEVLSPHSLREILKNRLKSMIENYGL